MPIQRQEAGFGAPPSPAPAGERGGFVLVFRTRRDGRVRPEHAALEGRTWDLTDPEAPTPPLAYGCRCSVQIEPRAKAQAQATASPVESFARFKDLEANLAQVYPDDVVQAYREHLLPLDLIIQRTGDRISTDQARAIIASRRAEEDPKNALLAIGNLADRGISGRVLGPIVDDARARIARGSTAQQAAKDAILGTPKRGYVTPTTAPSAASDLVRSRLLEGVDPAPTEAPGVPPPEQPDQRALEGQPLRKPTVPPPWGEAGPAPAAPDYVTQAERIIARRTTERLLAWDWQGNLLGSSEGAATWADVPADLPKDSVITHNHPSGQRFGLGAQRAWGTSLSPADLRVAVAFNARRIRAVSPSGAVFEMTRPAGGWPTEKELRPLLERADDEIHSRLQGEIDAGRISGATAEAMHAHEVNQIVAKAIKARYRWGIHD